MAWARWLSMVSLGFAGIVGVVFVVQPARKAATPHPVEALRG
jgi:ABC-type antimicrobial peptide transport system permease subunit